MKKQIKEKIKRTSLVVVGTALTAFATAAFLLPFEIISGGISGTALVLGAIVPSEVISRTGLIAVITWLLFIPGLIFLGKGFAAKTLLSTLLYPPFVSLFSYLGKSDLFGAYFSLSSSLPSDSLGIIAALAGGALLGFGCALSFIGGGSTGGTDTVALTLSKLFPRLKSSEVIFITDASIISLGLLVIGDLRLTLLGIISALITALVIDKSLYSLRRALVAEIISSEADRIKDLILDTALAVSDEIFESALLGTEKKLLRIDICSSDLERLDNILSFADKNASLRLFSVYANRGTRRTV